MDYLKNDIPIMKTFTHNGKYYLYDTYTNRLLHISKEYYAELNDLQRIGLENYKQMKKDTLAYNGVLGLIQKGMLKTAWISEIVHPATKFIDAILNRCLSDLTLQVTRNCNLRCRYCLFANKNGIERGHEKVNMPWLIAKRSVDFLYEHSKDARKLTIAFYGGEPMLNFSLIKKVTEYSAQLFFSKNITYRMTINGTVLTNDMIEFLVKNNFYIAISFDGPTEIQNRHRKFLDTGADTYNTVINNIERIKESSPLYFERNVSFIPVAFADEDEHIVFNFFKEHGISPDKLLFLDADLSGVDYNSNYLLDYAERRFNYSKDEDAYSNKATIPSKWHHKGPCIPSIKSLFVDVDGSFYPCEGFLALPELAIGNIENGFDREKIISYLNIGQIDEGGCKSCWLMRFCSICALNCIDVDKKMITREQKKMCCEGQEYRAISFLKEKIKSTN